jgi:branched-chain amino acid aminotransferase
MKPILYNGKIVAESEIDISILNRGFMYGDGFFETILVRNNTIPFFDLHIKRILKSFAIIGFDGITDFAKDKLKSNLLELLKLEHQQNSKIRISFFRNGNAGYLSNDNSFSYLATCSEYEFQKAKKSSATIYFDNKKDKGQLSNLKSANALLYVLSAQYAADKGFEHSIILNSENNVVDATHSNVFIIHQNKIITSPLADGCVDGVCRKILINNFDVIEQTISVNQLLQADEIFLTNAIKLIQPINKLEEKIFSTTQSDNFAKKLIELIT